MKTLVFDIEIFPNLFTTTFVSVDNSKPEKNVFYVGLGKLDYLDIKEFLKGEFIFIGYNNKAYDDCILRFIENYRGVNLNKELFRLSGKLINDSYRNDKEVLSLRYPRDITSSWKSVDLMTMLGFDRSMVSLKQVAINLKHEKIQDLPLAYDAYIQDTQLELILEYNENDAKITKKLYEAVEPQRKLRSQLEDLYYIDFSSASKSKIGSLIFEKFYSKEIGVDVRSLKELRTNREKVLLGDCIARFVNFESPELKEMLDCVSSTIVYEYTKYKYSEKIYFANCVFSLGIGGIHTDDSPGSFISNENHIIIDADVSSYYPNLIINNNFYPAHLGINFIKVLNKITSERISAKKAGDKIKAEAMKISINAIFGKLKYENYWLYDPKQLLSTTISGQLGLLMLVEGLYLNGIEILSCNTDGVVSRVPKGMESTYYEIAKKWEEKTNLELEFTIYKKYIRRDVNSYITEKNDGTIKEKNSFLTELDLAKAYHMPIVAKALRSYFIDGTPVKNTIAGCKDIMDFCISQKAGEEFSVEFHTTTKKETLQKTNRFYISTTGGSLIKRNRTSGALTGLYVGKAVKILNDYDPTIPFKAYAVDLSFYEKEVMKIVDEIEPKQMQLFDISSLAKSGLKKADVSLYSNGTESVIYEETMRAKDLNKLGKNQLIKKIESIVNSNQKIEKISPRYIYVLNFNSRSMMADVYCLAKAVRQTIAVDKTAYKKTMLEKGKLVFCSRFSKTESGYVLADYKITDKIEEERPQLMEP